MSNVGMVPGRVMSARVYSVDQAILKTRCGVGMACLIRQMAENIDNK
jgi:hypothetical protein